MGRARGTVGWEVEEWGGRHRLRCKGRRGSTRGILGWGRRGGETVLERGGKGKGGLGLVGGGRGERENEGDDGEEGVSQ